MPEPLRFDWQNRRVGEDSLEWSHSGKQLLLSVRGDLFLFSLDTGTWEQLTATPEAERDPKLSPDGTRVAFRRGHDLYTLEIATRQVDAAHRRRQRYAAERRTRLGVSRRTGSEHGVLVVARFQAHRLHAVRHRARVHLSAGGARRIARRRRAGALSASRHRRTPMCAWAWFLPRAAPHAGWIWATRAAF